MKPQSRFGPKVKTIALSEQTFEKLREVRTALKSKSFEETIVALLEKRKRVPKSMFGIDKGKLKPYTKKDRMEFEGHGRF